MLSLRITMLAALVAAVSASSLQAQSRLRQLPSGRNQERITAQAAQSERNQRSTRFGSGTITPTGPSTTAKPDLTVLSLSKVGDGLRLLVGNVGNAVSQGTEVRIEINRRSDGARINGRTAQLGSLQVNQTQVFRFRGLELENVRVLAAVDPFARIGEKNEWNNTRRMLLGESAPALPDLDVGRISVTQRGFMIRVSNNGTRTANSPQLRVRVTRRTDGATIRGITLQLPSIAAGRSTTATVEAALLTGVTVVASADPANLIRESQERNNSRAANFGR